MAMKSAKSAFSQSIKEFVMPEYTVHLQQNASTAVKVEADDPEDALELAWQDTPGGLCAQCSGWGNPPGIDLAGEWEPYEVVDAEGNTVWSERIE
jgi:hypothetical protein